MRLSREIARLCVPNIISNVSVPLLSTVDMIIAGKCGGEQMIGALAIGTGIFNFIYWLFSFLRMGTSGLTAQAFGKGDLTEQASILLRSLLCACVCGVVLLAASAPLGRISVQLMQGGSTGSEEALRYFSVCVLSVPAGIAIFSLQGWFIGMQDSRTPMIVAIGNNLMNIAFSLLYVFRFGMGIEGIALGTVTAQYISVGAYAISLRRMYRGLFRHADMQSVLAIRPLLRFLRINRDILLRTMCIVTVYTFFTAASARYGDTVLAVNSILMQLFLIFSYMTDGFAYTAESLTGRFIGERDIAMLRLSIRKIFRCCLYGSLLFCVAYLLFWEPILSLFSAGEAASAQARSMMVWIVLTPLTGFIPFVCDGILVGATKALILRDSVFVSLAVFFPLWFILRSSAGETALWAAFLSYMISRGVYILVATGGLDSEFLMDTSRERMRRSGSSAKDCDK